MNCRKVLEIYQRYLDNELEDNRARSVENHVSSCSRCKKVLIIERRFKAVIVKKIKREEAPPELKHKIRTKIFRRAD
ncbi:MAG: anti-sigma factor family protein [bacterium]